MSLLILAQAIKALKEPSPGQLDIFGKYVAMELRGVRCEQIRKRAKREINSVLLKAQDEDQGQQQFEQSSPVF